MKMTAQAPDENESPLIVSNVTARQFFRDRITLYRHAELLKLKLKPSRMHSKRLFRMIFDRCHVKIVYYIVMIV